MVSLKAMTKALMFDLDNTLYSEYTGMERMVLERINGFVSTFLGWPAGETHARRKEGAKRYGTTLEWLVYEKGLKDVEGYFSFVHPEGEEACLADDEALRQYLDSLDYRKIVLTNAPIEHAERVLKTLGIRDRFSAVYDIKYNKLVGKPHPTSYLRALEDSGLALETTVFIDDSPKYIRGYLALGGRAILKDEGERFANLGFERIKTLADLPALL
ncbi:MAG: HAD-IA family hydrolase [Rectinemataceae bacterium]|nr:HAD-IA family hydrolase [Rectinemataceae bacterium]